MCDCRQRPRELGCSQIVARNLIVMICFISFIHMLTQTITV